MANKFQSTRPVWGATDETELYHKVTLFQSTRPVWGATVMAICYGLGMVFQSTRPVWGATKPLLLIDVKDKDFNPRAPCGARQQI